MCMVSVHDVSLRNLRKAGLASRRTHAVGLQSDPVPACAIAAAAGIALPHLGQLASLLALINADHVELYCAKCLGCNIIYIDALVIARSPPCVRPRERPGCARVCGRCAAMCHACLCCVGICGGEAAVCHACLCCAIHARSGRGLSEVHF
jgi:hypothetical protein